MSITSVAMMKAEDACEVEMTPEEIRRVLEQLARRSIDEQGARPAIEAYNRILRTAGKAATAATHATTSGQHPK